MYKTKFENCITKLHDDIISACLNVSEIIPETG